MHHRLITAAGALLLPSLLLTGCVPSAPPRPKPTAEARMTDAEVLDAATAAYARYLKLSDEIESAPGDIAGRLDDVAAGPALEKASELNSWLLSQGLRGTGETRFDNPSLESRSVGDDGVLTVEFIVCNDVSETRVIDAGGVDVTPSDRDDRLSFRITAVSSDASSTELRIVGGELWSNGSSSAC